MAISTKPLTIGGVILGGGAAATGSTYALTKESISNKVEGNVLPKDGVNSEWKVKVAEAKKDIKLKNQIFKTAGDEVERKALYEWCQEKLGESYGSAFSSKDEELLNKVKKLCIYSIKEKLNETSRLLETETDFKELVKKLKANKEDSTLSPEFKKVANTGVATSDEGWQEFKKLCSSIYERGYQGSEDKNLSFSEKYCAKATILEKLSEIVLPKTGFETEWSAKITKATTSGADETLKAKLKDATNKNKDLQDWCEAQYIKAYDKLIEASSTSTPLLIEVKNLCSLTIEEKMDENSNITSLSVDDDSKKSEWQAKMTKLKSHPETATDNEPALAFGLKEIKEKHKSETNESGWKDLREWCKNVYKKGYRADNLWKLAEKFCKKDN